MASTFAPASSLCRLCRGPVVTKNSVALISTHTAVLERLAERIGELLETTVAADDRVCRPCKSRFDSLEKALEDLESFRLKASESRGAFLTSGKRMRDSMGVSPDTMRVRPALKRFNSQNAEPDES